MPFQRPLLTKIIIGPVAKEKGEQGLAQVSQRSTKGGFDLRGHTLPAFLPFLFPSPPCLFFPSLHFPFN